MEFMDYVQNAFYIASNWQKDNSYGALTATSQALLDFQTPTGLRFSLSSLSSPNFATSYTLRSVGLVDGSVSYLYSSLPLSIPCSSSTLNLRHIVPGYRRLQDLRRPDEPWWWEVWQGGKRIDRRDALLYGRLFLPKSTLEGLYLRRLSPRSQVNVRYVSDSRLPNGGSMLALLQHDRGKFSTEYLYSTDSALLGIRGLYNFGPEPPEHVPERPQSQALDTVGPLIPSSASMALPTTRLSAGGECYFSPLNKSGGMSTGLRFSTLPRHTGFPYTMTLTLNPLMGNLSSSYSVVASPLLALSTRFDFNVYSYESDFVVGMELWRLREEPVDEMEWAKRKMGKLVKNEGGEQVAGVLKARMDQSGTMGFLWEGRIKELLYSCGVNVDLKGGENLVRGLGVEVSYSS
ncbi:MAG: hypothetical protein Q9195_009621 [Heterodermia aff. obscurata]